MSSTLPPARPGDEGLAHFVFSRAQANAGRTALVDRSRSGDARRWNYAQLTSAVSSLARSLRSAGLREGDVVALLTENSAEFVIAYHGILAAGGVVLPLDPRGTKEEWTAELTRGRAEALIAEAALWPTPPPPALGVIRIGEAGDGEIPWDRLVSTDDDSVEVPAAAGGDRPAVLMSSSGTQGLPKKVVVTHHNLAAGLAQIDEVHRLGDTDTVTCVGPLRHIYGMQMAMNPALRAGITLVIGPARFAIAEFMKWLDEDGVTVAYLVPSVVAEIAALPDPVIPRALRLVVSGGAPLPATAAAGCEKALHVPVVQGFGMTEGGCVSFTPDGAGRTGTVGVVLPGTDARFVDPATGTDTGGDRPGELWVRGPQITPGYLDDNAGLVPVRDAEGWFRTGDLAVLDPGGYLRIVGRLKSLIKYKGHQVSPAELEEILVAHPSVADALVVGQPDPVAGELPKAYVVVDPPVPLAEVTAHVAGRVAAHKRIRVIERVPEIPRSVTGKPARPPALRVLVTGGGRGLGREFTTSVVAAGGSVLAVGRDEAALASTAEAVRELPGRLEYFPADLTDPAALIDAVRAAEDAFGGIDVLVNNAGVPGPHGRMWEVEPSEWRATFDVNLLAAQQAVHTVVPAMVARGFGRVVNVVSRSGRLSWPGVSAYAVSKAALIALTANLGKELRDTGVTTVAFDPGLVDIGLTRGHLDRGEVGHAAADRVLRFLVRAQDNGQFTPLPDSITAFSRIVTGGADERSGEYVTVEELLSP
ncbi:SDR family NAD(P)-dependent oxidoreductase [Amycolatopsis pithecellobii]|uniref:SDR family NAD(P)-dependent oxidoreductase n=1 Tax=Amycolatopsis pithecellobii TaxID=664692 RepID=UPI0014072A61|nr:SDR family NAD(P)-dependent oxidoreductase [Amycolatopsis pithecellobii]